MLLRFPIFIIFAPFTSNDHRPAIVFDLSFPLGLVTMKTTGQTETWGTFSKFLQWKSLRMKYFSLEIMTCRPKGPSFILLSWAAPGDVGIFVDPSPLKFNSYQDYYSLSILILSVGLGAMD